MLFKVNKQGIVNFLAARPRLTAILASLTVALAIGSIDRFFGSEVLAYSGDASGIETSSNKFDIMSLDKPITQGADIGICKVD